MPFHRLVAPTYLGGLPSGFDYLNDPAANGDPGAPAPMDGKKSTGLNEGTYFDAFGEDATSLHANRGNKALAENCDYLDNVASTPTPVLDSDQFTVVVPTNYISLPWDIFVGKLGTSNNQVERDKLACLVTDADRNEVIDATGVRVAVSQIDNGVTNVVGTEASGFHTSCFFRFSATLPAGVYRLYYGRKSRLSDIIDTTVDIGSILAGGVRTAHKAPAEVVRFMKEASEHVSGAISALCTNVLETRGTGTNLGTKSDEMYLDIDPSDDTGLNARVLHIRAGRDGTPISLLDVSEATKTGNWALIKTGNSDLAFGDSRTDLNNGVVPLSSSGHPFYRKWGKNASEQPSILEMYNRRWTVTCGDGVNSFGDFNGGTALADALAFATSNSVVRFCIFLKNGTYTLPLTTLSTDYLDIHIEGESKSGTTIVLSAAVGFYFTGSRPRFHVENVTLQAGGTSKWQAVASTKTSYMLFENCYFDNTQVSTRCTEKTFPEKQFGNYRQVFRHCSFYADPTPTLTAEFVGCLHDDDTLVGAYTAAGVLFEDCTFTREDEDCPIARLVNNTATSVVVESGWTFSRCTMNLGSTGTTAGGDMEGNCGVFLLEPGSNGGLRIKSLNWLNCNVYANSYSTPGANSILLFLPNTNGLGGNIPIEEIVINGGEWLCKATTELSPFYIGSGTFNRAYSGASRFTMRDVTIGNDSSGGFSNGAPHATLSFADGVGYWAGYVIGATGCTVENVKWKSPVCLSDSGQMWLYAARELRVDGIKSSVYSIGSGGTPRYRFRFGLDSSYMYHQAEVANVTVTGMGSSAPGVVDSLPNEGGVFWLDKPLATPRSPFIFRNCTVKSSAATIAPGFYQEPALAAASSTNGHVHYVECSVVNHGGEGYKWNTDETPTPLEDLVFSRCTFDTCFRGVEIGGLSGGDFELHDIKFDHNTFVDCDEFGVFITMDATGIWSMYHGGAVFTGNYFDNNMGAESGIQVVIATGNPKAVGAAYGNRSAGDGGGRGVFSMQGVPSAFFRGTETSYTYQETGTPNIREITYVVGTGGTTPNVRNHYLGDPMMHNEMFWG